MGNDSNWVDFIYIIIAAAIGLIGKFIKKNKGISKPIPSTPQQDISEQEEVKEDQSQTGKTIFGDVFNEMFNLEEEKEEEQVEIENGSEKEKMDVLVDKIRKGRNDKIISKKEKEIKLETLDSEDNFDLKQAVIYSEMLNKKYC